MFTWTKSATMKNAILISVLILWSSFSSTAYAQNAEVASNSYNKAVALEEKPDAPAQATVGKDVVITLKNTSERPIAIFAGPKENIRDPKIFTYGGLSSNNKLYLHENEVICLMTVDKRPSSCTVIKPGITLVEVNTSANAISGK